MSKQKIGEASLILAAGTILINLLQIVKLLIVSRLFGASEGLLDPYAIAQRVPLAVQGVVLGTLQMSFIPIYVGHLARKEKAEADSVLGSTMSFGLAFYGVVVALLAIYAEPVLRPMTLTFTPERFAETVGIFRILLGMLLLGGIADLISAFYMGNQRYFLPSIAPVVSGAISVGYLVAFPDQGPYNLAYGLVLGMVGQLALLLWGAVGGRSGFRLHVSRAFISRLCIPIYWMMLPVAGGLILSNANQLIDFAVAGSLGQGPATILDYAAKMHDVLMKLFAASIGGALLPFLSQYVAEMRFADFRQTIVLGTRLSVLTLLPAAVLVYLFGAESLSAVFQGGKFTSEDAIQVGATWAAYTAGLYVITDAIFKGRALIAIQDLQPLWITVAVSIPINIWLDVTLAEHLGVKGIALATGIVYLLHLTVYGWRLRRYYRATGAAAPHVSPLWKSLTAILLLAALAYALRHFGAPLIDIVHHTSLSRRLAAMAAIGTAVAAVWAVYLGTLIALGVDEASMLLRFFKRLVRRG